MSDLWFLFRYVHCKQHELPDRGSRYGTSRKRNHSGSIFRTYPSCKTCRYAGYGNVQQKHPSKRHHDKRGILNALTVDMALGCSTNSMLHLPAIAHEIGMDFDISFANEISEKTPNLCHLAPAGPTYMEDLNEAGGVYAVMNELNKQGLLHTECMTVTGKTVGENIKGLCKPESGSYPPDRQSIQQDRRTCCTERKPCTGWWCCKTFCSCTGDDGS